MMYEFFNKMEAGISEALRANPDKPEPKKRYTLEVARLAKRLYSGTDQVAWCGVTVPFELLHAMDVSSCFVEFIGGALAFTGGVAPYLEEAERAGYASDTCGYHRSVVGAASMGLMPKPSMIIGMSAPCTGGLGVMENLARIYKKDLMLLDVPLTYSETNVKYLADQLEAMMKFIADHTGRRFDPERLREAVELSNRTREFLKEVYTLAATVPSPAGGRDLVNFGIVLPLFFGTQGGLDVAKAYRDEFAARVQAGVSGIPQERFRLMWLQNRIQFRHSLDSMLEREYRAAVVVDELNDVTWEPVDPDDPFTGFARRVMSIPLNRTVSDRIAHVQELARAYRVDGAINPCHWGCRQGTGSRGLIQEGLKEIGVPVLNLEVDCVDPRNFAVGQLKTRIEAFMETLEGRPSPWAKEAVA